MLLKFSLSLSDYLLFQGVVNAIPHTWKLPLNNGDYMETILAELKKTSEKHS